MPCRAGEIKYWGVGWYWNYWLCRKWTPQAPLCFLKKKSIISCALIKYVTSTYANIIWAHVNVVHLLVTKFWTFQIVGIPIQLWHHILVRWLDPHRRTCSRRLSFNFWDMIHEHLKWMLHVCACSSFDHLRNHMWVNSVL